MKISKSPFIGLIAMFISQFSLANAQTLKFDLQGNPEFLSEAPLEKIVGVSEGLLALEIDFTQLASLKAVATVPIASMRTGNDIRDEHLRSETWLNASANPNIVFTSKAVDVVKKKGDANKGKAQLIVNGDISINGVSKPLTANVKIKWSQKSVKAKTKFSVALADFNVKGSKGTVGNKVGKTIDIKGTFSVKR